jgi:hypothetical protein
MLELLFVLLDAGERATLHESFGDWIAARLNDAWLVHYREARHEIKTRDKGQE